MRNQKYHLYLDSDERKLAIHCLNELRNSLIEQGRYTDTVDEVLYKLVKTKPKKMKIKYV